MSAPLEPKALERTIAAQQRASAPRHSAWVSANAGSGKTTVLTNRVMRLLLAGTEPSRILCLTFTKAAAAEMSSRVFDTLARWALLDEEALSEAIESVQGEPPDATHLDMARTLFARSLETPGGLKVQTIHSFCEGILRQFPLEANVPSRFQVLQDEPLARMLAEARDAMWVAARDDARLAQAAERAMAHASDDAIERSLEEAIANREELAVRLGNDGPDGAERETLAHFGFAGDETRETIAAGFAGPLDHDTLRAILRRAETGRAAADASYVAALGPALESDDPAQVFQACCAWMLTSGGTVRATIVSKPVAGTDKEALAAQGEAARETLGRIRTLETIRRTRDLMVLAEDVIRRYDTSKRAAGYLDFEDMIARTADLLERSHAAAWVHYKLDRGLHHVLVDEAQDTSPRQWRIITRLVEEFFAGEGAVTPDDIGTGIGRTVFAVGDEKQSIFSFQGARPETFETQRERMRAMAEGARGSGGFADVPLSLSFRSTQDVLSAVDRVFDHPERGDGLTSGAWQPHVSRRADAPGSVEIWDLATREDTSEPQDWTAPIDAVSGGHQTVVAAKRIADRIKHWLESGETIEATGELIRPRDILVLVRTRDAFVTALTRALKSHDVPVAGVDRLVLTDHIAVQDLVALGRTVLLPEDDLSLAEVLRSPLLGLSEDELYALAQGRDGTLDAALMASNAHPIEAAQVRSWRELAELVPVHEFYARVLGPQGGRSRFYERLGQEAEDVLDAFLQAALDHERTGPSGLQGFVAAMTGSEQEIKREGDAERDEVRIMTVHGAKGLEAPIVFVVDKASSRGSNKAPTLYDWGAGYLWASTSEHHSPASRDLSDALKAAADAEYRRLLYVAMTRAADRLIVTGYHGKVRASGTWHDMVSAALENDCTRENGPDGETYLRFQLERDGAWSPKAQTEPGERRVLSTETPDWMGREAPPAADVPRPLTPSGAQALVENDRLRGTVPTSLLSDESETPRAIGEVARRRGTLVHRLLQTLPDMAPDMREGTAIRYLRATLREASDTQIADLVAETLAVIDDAATRPLLSGGRAEVAVMGRLDLASGPRMVSGQIDRLHVADGRTTIVDYKTNRVVPHRPEDVPDEYVTQLALYRALVGRIYADRAVRAVLVWTHAPGGPAVMEMPDAALDAALATLEAA